MSFIYNNDGFVCEWCGTKNPPAKKTCRNHCVHCLCSKHVDELFPGDRASICGGKLEVSTIEISSQYEYILVHCCQKCKKIIRNKTAEDDNKELLFLNWKAQEQNKILGK